MSGRNDHIVPAYHETSLSYRADAYGAHASGDAGKDSYYIEQHSFADPDVWDKVVLIFGYGDSNAEVCNDFKQ